MLRINSYYSDHRIIESNGYYTVESYYNSLDVLAKKLQDDYAGIKSFEQSEEDRLGLCFLLDYTDDLREKIKALVRGLFCFSETVE